MEFFKTLWNDMVNAFGNRVQLGTNTITTLGIIVWSLFLGFLIAIAVTLYNKIVVGAVIRGIIEKKAHSEANALTLKKTGYNNVFAKTALLKSGTLRKIVKTADADSCINRENIDNARFYIPEECVKKALLIYGQNGISLQNVLLALVGLIIVTLAIIYFVPDLIHMTENISNSISVGKSNIL